MSQSHMSQCHHWETLGHEERNDAMAAENGALADGNGAYGPIARAAAENGVN